MKIAVLGLGEAGGRIAADLVAAGCELVGFDPARRPDGIECVDTAVDAVTGANVVLSVNAATVALETAVLVAPALAADVLYADLNTATPDLKRDLAAAVPVPFADVALVGVVPASGLATPALASGAGAARFAEVFRPLGMPVDVVSGEPGDAAGLKLLRSVFMKGMAAAAIESLTAAEAAGVEDWVRSDIASVLGESLLRRLITGSTTHAARRAEEMHAATTYVQGLGVEPWIAAAAAAWLEHLRDGGPNRIE